MDLKNYKRYFLILKDIHVRFAMGVVQKSSMMTPPALEYIDELSVFHSPALRNLTLSYVGYIFWNQDL